MIATLLEAAPSVLDVNTITNVGGSAVTIAVLLYLVRDMKSATSEIRQAEHARTEAVIENLGTVAATVADGAKAFQAATLTTHAVIQEARELLREVRVMRAQSATPKE